MDLNFSENVVVISVQKKKNAFITLLENVPADKLEKILTQCRQKFGCGGSVMKDTKAPTIQLQGDQKFSIEKFKNSIFEGLDVKMKDLK